MRVLRITMVLGLALACSEPMTPPDAILELEPVDYSLLGTGKIAFERIGANYHRVYFIDPVAQSTTLIGASGEFTGPALSPDGNDLLVAEYDPQSGMVDIFAHHRNGSNRRITGSPTDEGVPSWTPDGTAITFLNSHTQTPQLTFRQVQAVGAQSRGFTLNRDDACSTSYLGNLEDRIEVASTGLIATPCHLTELVILSNSGVRVGRYQSQGSSISGFAWSPDGSKLAVVELMGPADSPISQTLRIVSPEGESQRVVFTVPLTLAKNGRYPGAMDTGPCWLKGVDRLLVPILNEGRRHSQLWVVNEDGTGLTKITTAAGVTDRSVTCSR